MIDLPIVMALTASVIHGIGFVKYNLQTREGASAPRFVSWFVWALLATLNALTFSAAAGFVVGFQTFVGAAGCIGIFIYALWAGVFAFPKRREWTELIICLVSIYVWHTSSALNANLVLFLAMILSFEPTIHGVWNNPKLERKSFPWWCWTSAYAITAISTFLFSGGWTLKLVMPVSLIVAHGIVPVIVQYRLTTSCRSVEVS